MPEGERRMLKVDQYSYIRTAHRVYGKKIKQIARETGHSRNTIKKVLRSEYSGYKPRIKQSFPILGPYLKVIDKWLTDDKKQSRKQRHTAVRIYNRLKQEHNFQGAEIFCPFKPFTLCNKQNRHFKEVPVIVLKRWSGREDLNFRPLEPHSK